MPEHEISPENEWWERFYQIHLKEHPWRPVPVAPWGYEVRCICRWCPKEPEPVAAEHSGEEE